VTGSTVLGEIRWQSLESDRVSDDQTFPDGRTLTGSMKICLTNVWLTLPDGRVKALTSANADAVRKLETSGDNVKLDIDRHGERGGDRDDP
jgi:hypothetical protein